MLPLSFSVPYGDSAENDSIMRGKLHQFIGAVFFVILHTLDYNAKIFV